MRWPIWSVTTWAFSSAGMVSTLDAVQYLANILIFRGIEDRKRIIIDAEDYRDRREEVLRSSPTAPPARS